jgi:hypothetical protein
LSTFSVAFSQPTFQKGLVLLYGTILAPRRRAVAAALRMTGHGDDPRFSRFHRFLNRDHWSPWLVSRILLSLVIVHLVPPGAGLVLLIDDTLERRRGPEINLKGWCHEPLLAASRKWATSSAGDRPGCLPNRSGPGVIMPWAPASLTNAASAPVEASRHRRGAARAWSPCRLGRHTIVT